MSFKGISPGFITENFKALLFCCSVAQSCPSLCDPMDCSMPSFHVLSPSPGACSNSCPLSQWCHPTISSSVIPFSSCLQSFPASGSFLMSPAAAAAAKSLQSCPTLRPHRRQPTRLCRPWDSPGTTLEWVAISFSIEWKWKVKVKSLSRVQLVATPWTAAYQAPPSMAFSRQEYWSGLPLPSPNESC